MIYYFTNFPTRSSCLNILRTQVHAYNIINGKESTNKNFVIYINNSVRLKYLLNKHKIFIRIHGNKWIFHDCSFRHILKFIMSLDVRTYGWSKSKLFTILLTFQTRSSFSAVPLDDLMPSDKNFVIYRNDTLDASPC